MSGFDIQKEVAAAIAEAGAEVGTGSPLKATLLKPGTATGPEWDPQPGKPIPHEITVLDTYRVIRGEDGQAKAQHILKAAVDDPDLALLVSDEVVVNGSTFSVADVKPVQPGGVVLMWELILDR